MGPFKKELILKRKNTYFFENFDIFIQAYTFNYRDLSFINLRDQIIVESIYQEYRAD